MNAMYLIVVVLLILAIAYRYYSAFIAAKVLALDDSRITPAHLLNDGQNYHPTNKWVLFGHHFAAISGAGPLIGPVLAAQFGYLPSLLWILLGVCLGGAVQDFVILVFSIRREGKSLARIAYDEIGGTAATAATIGILFVLVIALAGLGKVVVKALGGDTVTYETGTKFLAPSDAGIRAQNQYDNVYVYVIPEGTRIQYTNGAEVLTSQKFTLTAKAVNSRTAISLETPDRTVRAGEKIEVFPNVRVERKIAGSSWGTFTIALTIPIALFTGLYMYRIRKGKVLEASIIGGLLTLGAVYLGGFIDTPEHWLNTYKDLFDLREGQITIAMAIYGFLASILPVWILLCPRDYLSSFLKIGTVILLVIGVILAQPILHTPALNWTFITGGPTVPGNIFPFVFITIMCGAISGFHSLVSSGTTPKMINKEKDARTIGYGAMLIEGLVAIVALIAACSLPTSHYYQMNTSWKALPQYQQQIAQIAHDHDTPRPGEVQVTLAQREAQIGETLQGRTGGAVTLAVGMAQIFDDAAKRILGSGGETLKKIESLIPYWYHFAIMFEAIFILTTIDTGTRVGRFLLQETLGKWVHPKLAQTNWWPGAILTTALMVGGWSYFISSRSMDAIWPMFGIANQMLAVIALSVATVVIVKSGRAKYAWVTLLPMFVVATTTTSAAVIMLIRYFREISANTHVLNNAVSAFLILVIVVCTATVLTTSYLRVRRP